MFSELEQVRWRELHNFTKTITYKPFTYIYLGPLSKDKSGYTVVTFHFGMIVPNALDINESVSIGNGTTCVLKDLFRKNKLEEIYVVGILKRTIDAFEKHEREEFLKVADKWVDLPHNTEPFISNQWEKSKKKGFLKWLIS